MARLSPVSPVDADPRTTCLPPRVSGLVRLRDGRDLSYAEFGDPRGLPVLWLHGTPGASRQVAPAAVAAASEMGVRIVGIARPGAGHSTPHAYGAVADIAGDVEQLVDRLGIDDFAVVGLSGGGPYTLALGAKLSDRVRGLCVLGGVPPAVGPDATEGGVVAFLARHHRAIRLAHRPVGRVLNTALKPVVPLGHSLGDAFFRFLPEADRRVFQTPGVKEMFVGDFARSITEGFGTRAALRDAVLFGRDWGFRLSDVTVPVQWWHGDVDWCIDLPHGQHCVARLPDATLRFVPGGSHLTGYAAADEVIEAVKGFFA